MTFNPQHIKVLRPFTVYLNESFCIKESGAIAIEISSSEWGETGFMATDYDEEAGTAQVYAICLDPENLRQALEYTVPEAIYDLQANDSEFLVVWDGAEFLELYVTRHCVFQVLSDSTAIVTNVLSEYCQLEVPGGPE